MFLRQEKVLRICRAPVITVVGSFRPSDFGLSQPSATRKLARNGLRGGHLTFLPSRLGANVGNRSTFRVGKYRDTDPTVGMTRWAIHSTAELIAVPVSLVNAWLPGFAPFTCST
jgi:hypothetical protein